MADAEQTVEDAVDPQQELVDETAARLTEIANQSLDSNEVARQIEELTSVVLDSAEVSTRSASIAADVSTTMREVVSQIQENNRRNVLHSRIMLGAFCACLLIAMGVFFGVTVKMTKSIKELDTMIYAMAKRVIEVDASLTAISKTHSDFAQISEKQEELTTTQTRLASRLEEIGKSINKIPDQVAEQTNKVSEIKFTGMQRTLLDGSQKQFQNIEMRLQAIEAKAQSAAQAASAAAAAASAKPPPAPAGPNPQNVLNELQKLKQDLEKSNKERTQALTEAEKASAKKH